jgi:hypothetical protein
MEPDSKNAYFMISHKMQTHPMQLKVNQKQLGVRMTRMNDADKTGQEGKF